MPSLCFAPFRGHYYFITNGDICQQVILHLVYFIFFFTHDLRHSFCTMLYDAGVDLKSAMLWMGHADQQTTMSIYTHLTEQRRTEAEIALRNAEKKAFGMQNGMQNDLFHVEPLKNKALPDQG